MLDASTMFGRQLPSLQMILSVVKVTYVTIIHMYVVEYGSSCASMVPVPGFQLVQNKDELGCCLAIVVILSLCHLEQLFLRCFKDLQALIILGNLIPIYEPFKLGSGGNLSYMEIENTKHLPTFLIAWRPLSQC